MHTTVDPGNGFSQCGSCESPSVSCWCLDCEEALCADCVSAHRRVSVTRSHRLFNQPPTGDIPTPPTKFCRLHPSEPLKLVCFTCNRLTCRDCQLMNHMNHRYEFVSEAVCGLKKQLEDQVRQIRAQGDILRQSVQDMETRLHDVVLYESCLLFELQESYGIFLQQLKKRMMDLTKDIKKVHESERSRIERKIVKLKTLLEKQQSVTEAAEQAKNTNDVLALQRYKTQIEPQLKGLIGQDVFPPQVMPQMKVVTDSHSLMTLLNFGKLEVSWVPFCVSDASTQNPGAPGATTSCSSPQATLPPATTLVESTILPAPSNSPAAPSSGDLCPAAFTCSSSSSLCKALPQTSSAIQVHVPTSSTSVSGSLTPFYTAPISTQLSPEVSSCQSLKRFNVPFVTSSANNSSLFNQSRSAWIANTLSKKNRNRKQVPLKCVQPLSAFPLVLQPRKSDLAISTDSSSSSHTVLKSLPLVLYQSPSPAAILLTTMYQLYRLSLCFPLPQPPMLEKTVSVQVSQLSRNCLPPAAAKEKSISAGPSPMAQANLKQTPDHPPLTDQTSAVPSPSPSSLQVVASGIRPDSSLPKHRDLSHVVKAVADSACDHCVQQVEARQQEAAENEPTSTMCEETEPVESEPADSDSEEPASAAVQQTPRSSRWQPKVALFRLPVPPSRPGHLLPVFRLVGGDTDGEIYLEELSDDCKFRVDAVSEQLSPPDSPMTLEIVSCTACGSANGSIICLSCGRGYHRGCHVPPVGPDIRSEWACSLCQDLSDPSDPYSSERPQRPQSPCLSLLDQRKCESLLLYLKVEGCSRLSQSRLKLISDRLSLRRSPPYATAVNFLSDVWGLFKTTSSSQDMLPELQKSFRVRTIKTLGLDLHPPDTGPHQQHPSADVTVESRLKETRKRLREFFLLMGTLSAKRTKTE